MTFALAWRRYRRPFTSPVQTARGTWTVREGLVFELTADDGRKAYGEFAPIPGTGVESLAGAEMWLRHAATGTWSVSRLGSIPPGFRCLRYALAWPVVELARIPFVPAPRHRQLATAALLPSGPTAVEALRARAAEGFQTFKAKIARGGPRELELEEVRSLVAALPTGGRLRLDANAGLSREDARAWLEAARDWPLDFLEQPLAADDAEGHFALLADFPGKVALEESVPDLPALRRWRDRGWDAPFVIKPSQLGDPRSWMDFARRTDVTCVVSTAFETAIGFAQVLRIAFGLAGTAPTCGLGVPRLFSDGLGFPRQGPTYRPAELGLAPPEEVWRALG